MSTDTRIRLYEHGKKDKLIERLVADGIQGFSGEARTLLAMSLLEQGDFSGAKMALVDAPDDAFCHKIQGHIAYHEKRVHDAIFHYKRALELKPDYAEAAHDLGASYEKAGDSGQAIWNMMLAHRLEPEQPIFQRDLGLAKLAAGDEGGWQDFRARHRVDFPEIQYKAPEWQGEPVAGKRVFILAEQGFGDQIQFLRYAKYFADQGARVLVGVHEKLKRLMNLQAGAHEIYEMGKPVSQFDTWTCTMSIPAVLGTVTTIGEPSLRIGRARHKSTGRIGLVWKGNPQMKGNPYRSIPEEALEPITKAFECLSYQFQVDDKPIDHLGLPDRTGNSFDFLDTAMRLLDEVDLLVTPCTGMAHLAGSINLPTLILLPQYPDFRWQLMPPKKWYPSMSAIKNEGGWHDTCRRAVHVVRNMLQERKRAA